MDQPGQKYLEERGYIGFSPLDSGGQGNVYLSKKEGREVAIKVIRVNMKRNEEATLDPDLQRELTILKNLRHPNCMRMEDAFRTKSVCYIVMPYLPNGSIGDVVRKRGPLCEWNCKVWFPPICRAVRYLHSKNVAHRDLKLDNVLLDEHFNPVVSDFGFSRFVQFTRSGAVAASETYCGTKSYNSPQILKSIPYDPKKCDIWCLGVMLWVMLNKAYPFDRTLGDDEMYRRMIKKEYRLEKKVEEKSSTQVKHLLSVLLEPNEKARWDIEAVCNHEWMPVILHEARVLLDN